MPYYVDVEIKASNKHGYGVFAQNNILKGTKVWSVGEIEHRTHAVVGYSALPNRVWDREMLIKSMNPDKLRQCLFGGFIYKPTVHLFI
jgi:hypothetical protein